MAATKTPKTATPGRKRADAPGRIRRTRRPSHASDRPARRFARPGTAGTTPKPATGTDLVLYTTPAERETLARRITERAAQLYHNAALALHRFQHRPSRTKTAKTVVVVPAHNEQDSIGRTIEALLAQTRRPDRIIVVADNCTDKTVQIAKRFGRRVTVVETVGNKDRKVGALATAWREYVAYGYDYMLGVDADTVLAPHTLEDLERELETNPKVGGVMAR